MANNHPDESYYDIFDDNNEMAFTPLSPHFASFEALESGAPVPSHTTGFANRTTPGLPTRAAPSYLYPATVTSARAGSHYITTSAAAAVGSAASPSTVTSTTIASTLPITTNSPSPVPLTTSTLGALGPTLPAAASASPPSYQTRPIPPFGFQSSIGWNSPSSSNSHYNSSSENSGSNSQLFEFGFPAHDTQAAAPSPYGNDFIAPSSIQNTHFRFGGFAPNPWHDASDTGATAATALTGPGTSMSLSSTIPSADAVHERNVEAEPLPLTNGAPPPHGDASATSSRRYKRAKRSTTSRTREVPTSPGATTTVSRASRTSLTSIESGPSSSTAAGSTAGSKSTKLRSASRTSKNTHHKPAETPEERKSRASHNLVEKQYRNRLNSQFENLLSAIPDAARSTGGDEDGGGGGEGDGDRKVSKAEVLDMARRHIKQLEQEKRDLERERNELLDNVEQLQETYSQALPPGATGMVPMPSPTGGTYQNVGTSPYADPAEEIKMSNGVRRE